MEAERQEIQGAREGPRKGQARAAEEVRQDCAASAAKRYAALSGNLNLWHRIFSTVRPYDLILNYINSFLFTTVDVFYVRV